MWSFGPLSCLAKLMEDEMGVQRSTKPLLPHESIRDHVMTGAGPSQSVMLEILSGPIPRLLEVLIYHEPEKARLCPQSLARGKGTRGSPCRVKGIAVN